MILKVAARNKKYNISEDDATMFTDPVTGATVRGDMMGINIKAIPTESQGKVCCSSAVSESMSKPFPPKARARCVGSYI